MPRARTPKVGASITFRTMSAPCQEAEARTYHAFGLAGATDDGPFAGIAFVGAVPAPEEPLRVTSMNVATLTRKSEGERRYQHVCFTPGALIHTPDGLRLVEDLQPGDPVHTRDRGVQPVRWIGRHVLDRQVLSTHRTLAPVRLGRNSIAPGVPARDMMVSPNHRIFLNDWRAELLFGTPEVLAPAHALVNDRDILRVSDIDEVEYIHLMFDHHEILRANGVETESFHPAAPILSTLDAAVRAELFTIFPDLMFGQRATPARRMLRADEARAILQA